MPEPLLPELEEYYPHFQNHVNRLANFSAKIPRMDIGARIQERLLELGMSQTELARRIGISRERVSQMIHGKIKRPSGDILRSIAEVLNIPLLDLYADLGEPLPSAESIAPGLVWAISQLDDDAQDILYRVALSLLPYHRQEEPRPAPGDTPTPPEPP